MVSEIKKNSLNDIKLTFAPDGLPVIVHWGEENSLFLNNNKGITVKKKQLK